MPTQPLKMDFDLEPSQQSNNSEPERGTTITSNFSHSSTFSTRPGRTRNREGPQMAIPTLVRVEDNPGL